MKMGPGSRPTLVTATTFWEVISKMVTEPAWGFETKRKAGAEEAAMSPGLRPEREVWAISVRKV
jgi:hypothetical protein